jgi:hypothetical protein
LRQVLPGARSAAPDPLLVFADPDFSHATASVTRKSRSVASRGFAYYFRDGVVIADALQDVPSLPGTRVEGEALEKALNGNPSSLLLGREASKAQLMQRNKDGRLAKVSVLEFATHGLVAGFASDLAEPALLLASEAATLNLNADCWVLLSRAIPRVPMSRRRKACQVCRVPSFMPVRGHFLSRIGACATMWRRV